MKYAIATALGGLAMLSFLPAAQAARLDPSLAVPSLTQDVACRVVRERIVRPNGAVVIRETRQCGHGPEMRHGGECRVMRDRVVRPNGSVDIRTRRICR
jgi:hypothetical protein